MSTALRDLLLATERAKAPLDAAVQRFAAAAAGDARVLSALLDVSPQAEPLVVNWPDESGKGTRWEDRESIALFLEIVTKLLRAQTNERNAPAAAEAMALKIVREKSTSLEKMLTWSDKPIVEFRVLELMVAIAGVNATTARELVRIFNFQSAAFSKIAGRRLKKATVAQTDNSEPADGSSGVTLSAFTKPKVSAEVPEAGPAFQIREVFVRLVAQLAGCPDKSVYRFALKDGGIVASLFESIDGDDAKMLAVVLGHLDSLVLRSENLDERGRVAIFNHAAIQQLLAVLKADDEGVARQVWAMIEKLFFGHDALYRLPTHQSLRLLVLKSGVNIAPVGDSMASEVVSEHFSLTVKVIRTVIGSVGLNDYVRSSYVRELVSKFVLEYPGLVAEFFSVLAPQLEPKTGYRWFCVASMVQNVLACSLEGVVQDLQSPTHFYDPVYSAQLLASRLVMPLNCRKELSRGLQHTNSLVIYASLGLIECALSRFQFILSYLPSDVTRSDLENELRFLLPSPETLVSLLMKLCASVDKAALVYLRSLTVFRLYLECLPLAMSEVKADFTKLLAWRYLDAKDGNTSRAIRGVVVGEILRILLVVDESKLKYVATSGSVGNGDSTKLSQLLQVFSSSAVGASKAVRSLTRAVLFRIFIALNVFGWESSTSLPAEEISIWLDNMVGCGEDVAVFVEMLLQDLVTDPFAFLGPSPDESFSPSPATLALIAAFKGTWPHTKSISKVEQCRQNSSIEAFASRVLLSLIRISVDPVSLARSLCSDANRLEGDEDPNNRSTKKRRRSDTLELATLSPFQCVATIARSIASPSTTQRVTVQSNQAPKEWMLVKGKRSFADALHKLDARSFVKSFSSIATNMLHLGLTSQLLHQFIASHPDVDLLALIKDVNDAKKKNSQFSAVLLDVVEALPVDLFSQQILFTLSIEGSKDEGDQSIKRLLNELTCRLDRVVALKPMSIACAAEQLICCIQICQSRHWFELSSALSDVVLRLHVCMRTTRTGDTEDPDVQVYRRLHKKVARAASVASSDIKLAALVVLALGDPDHEGESIKANELGLHRQGASVVTVVMVDQLPQTLRLEIVLELLDTRLHPKLNYPLVAHILRTLDQSQIHGFRRKRKLATTLWDALSVIPRTLANTDELEVLSPALHVVGSLGGVSEGAFIESLRSTWSQFISQRCRADTTTFADSFVNLVVFLRRLISVVSHRDVITNASQGLSELVQSVMKALETDERAKFQAISAILVSACGSGANSIIAEYALTTDVLTRAVEIAGQNTSPQVCALARIILRHAISFGDVYTNIPTKAFEAAVHSQKNSSITSRPPLLSLLMVLGDRTNTKTGWSAAIAAFLVRSAVSLALVPPGVDDLADAELSAMEALLRDMLKCAPSERDVHSVLKKSTVDINRLLTASTRESARAFSKYVRVSRILTLLVSAQNSTDIDGYSVHDHFDQLTSAELFPSSLRNPDINVEVIRLLACMLRLGGSGLYNRTLFQQLLGAYNMSLSLPDRMIRSLFEDFESKAGILASHYGYRFGSASAVISSQKVDGSARSDLIEDSAWLLSGGLEPSRVRATIESFPLNRSISVANDARLLVDEGSEDGVADCCDDVTEQNRSMVYDPSYLLPTLAHFVGSSALSETAMIQQGVAGVALRAISSNSDDVREFAYGILAHVHESLSADAATDFKPGRQVHLLLETLRNALQEPLEGVSSVITVFMNDVITILCRPSHTMYPHVNHFLLARPAFDLSDVPMFYALFNSHSPQTYKQERSWLLHGLRRGVREDADVSLLIRRHVPSILLSFFGSDLADEHTQLLVGNILCAMLKTEAGSAHLLLKCAFLEWLALHIQETADSGASTPIVSSLASLLEDSLKSEIWMQLDQSQREALSSAAIACYDALSAAVRQRSAFVAPVSKVQLARISLLLLERASFACSLSTLRSLVDAVRDFDSIATEFVEELVTSHLLVHREFQKARFAEWSGLLADVARILARESRVLLAVSGTASAEPPSINREIRALDVLRRLRSVLAQAPSLRLLVLNELNGELATKIMLL